MTIVEERTAITGGVDTHSEVHVAAALDPLGGILGTREFPDKSLPSARSGPSLSCPPSAATKHTEHPRQESLDKHRSIVRYACRC
jgi:hypothetical protein